MKAILLLMVFSGCAYAQQVQVKDVEFATILAVEEAEKYYNSLMAEEPEDSDNTAKYSEYRGQLAVDWLLKGNVEKYQFYKKMQPKFTALQLFELSNHLEDWVDNNTEVRRVEQISSELLGELEKGMYYDQFSRVGVLLEINAVANARLGNVQLAKERIEASNEKVIFRNFPYFRNSLANYLNRYAVILAADGQPQRALDTLSKAMRDANSTAVLRGTLREVYQQVNGSKKGLEEYIATLEEEAYRTTYENVQKEWKANGQAVPNIPLTDYDGKEIRLSTYKGKIVVIDFWSTVCKPCVAAFPAFERIVKEYSKDPFELFVINVGETADIVRPYMKKKGYTLNVLFDNHEKIFNAIGAIGTPEKFIIGTDGNIQLRGVGYAGSDDAEYYKLKAMVEVAKAHTKDL
ncbi:TlpA disulfide reductase family protein [Sphingobacterium alkalisoli]|nr:TlpA disulfide reductase family protein [Sphingobacterium alkalisoli]